MLNGTLSTDNFRTSQMAMLKPKTLDRFADLLRTRALPSETIVKLTAISIGCHWHARQNASIAPSESDAKRAKRRHDTEDIALDFVLAFFGMLIQTAVEELDEISLSNPLGDLDLHQHISAVLRRLLPALRIASKWIKLHLEYISRYLSTSNESLVTQIQSFWTRYKRLTSIFARLFPIAQLPTLTDKLEEDIDMRGFVPLSRGMSAPDSYDKEANGHREAAHPNEEQLMRVADLQVDAQLLIQSEVSVSP